MKNIYLISNSVHINKDIIDSLDISHNDTVVLFNHSHPLQFINHDKKILFIRETDGKLTGIHNDVSHYDKVYFFVTSDRETFSHYFNEMDQKNVNYNIININKFIEDFHSEYPENNLPTCGFLAYLHLSQKHHKDNIILVGFTGHHSNGSIYNGIEHNYMYEQYYYHKNDVKILHKKII